MHIVITGQRSILSVFRYEILDKKKKGGIKAKTYKQLEVR